MEYERRSIGLTYKRFEATLPRGIVTRNVELSETRHFSVVVLIVARADRYFA